MYNNKEYQKLYRIRNKDKIKEYLVINKEHISEVRKKRRECDKASEYQKIYQKQYRLDNKEKIKKYKKEYIKNRCKYDVEFKLLQNLRRRLHHALSGERKSLHTLELLGCSIPELKEWLQLKFSIGMTWENYGKWHVDHIIPCAAFNLSIEEEQKRCFNYTNLQPLWAFDNIKKRDKVYATATNY